MQNPLSPSGDFFLPLNKSGGPRVVWSSRQRTFVVDVSEVSNAQAMDYIRRVKAAFKNRHSRSHQGGAGDGKLAR